MKDEQRLIEDVLMGKHESFEPLLRPYRQGMLNMAYRMTGNLEEAKEVCQEAVFKVFRYLKTFKKGKSFKSWLYRVVMNSAYDRLRQEARHSNTAGASDTSFPDETHNPEKRYLELEIKEKIRASFRLLTPKEKSVFLLRDGEGMSIRETSEVLGCSSLSVRTHLSRARAKIRMEFARVYRLDRGK